ncbi:MAG: LysM peptidoglycan-binding domain-containing protein [Clostridia bacterium]|nr:LysM peptidoglycan-binding domain-containing protein [Clostridia bacterium]
MMEFPYRQCPPGTRPYVIRAGDTLYSLARRFNTTVGAIMSANPSIDPMSLRVGQRICIPMQPIYPPCPEGNYYIIRAGDTLYSIARRFNVSLDDLLEANPGIDPRRLFIGQVICIPSAAPPPACPPGSTEYVIKQGDTFYKLAQQFNVTVQALIAANPGVNPNALQIGQKICIPPAAPSPACPPGSTEYVIKQGDTFYKLAQQFNVTVQALIAANPGVNPNALQIGQKICIPPAAPSPACPPGSKEYVIKQGDTFYKLAQQFNVTVQALIAANPGVNPNALQIGQKICIPG